MRAAAHACAREYEHIIQVLHPLDPIHLCRGRPEKVRQIPLRLRNVFVLPAPTGLQNVGCILFFRTDARSNGLMPRSLSEGNTKSSGLL
jgi:hypothetical protein